MGVCLCMHRGCAGEPRKHITSSDEEGAPQSAQLTADERDPTDQHKAPRQSCSEAQDDQQGPETTKHCKI